MSDINFRVKMSLNIRNFNILRHITTAVVKYIKYQIEICTRNISWCVFFISKQSFRGSMRSYI